MKDSHYQKRALTYDRLRVTDRYMTHTLYKERVCVMYRITVTGQSLGRAVSTENPVITL